ncbi:MAG: FlgD immunoglobulin-like domain containing protein, partial [Candidatus Krumholzibacteriia bacterium]
PTLAGTTIRYTLGRPAAVTLAIHDLAGRRVRRLLDARPLPAGPHAAAWDGRDDNGAPVAAGAYTVLMIAGGQRRGGLVQISH